MVAPVAYVSRLLLSSPWAQSIKVSSVSKDMIFPPFPLADPTALLLRVCVILFSGVQCTPHVHVGAYGLTALTRAFILHISRPTKRVHTS